MVTAAGCLQRKIRKTRGASPTQIKETMSKSDIFNDILRKVSEETEISCPQILSRRKDMETVDARYLLVHFLSETGFSSSYIAAKIGVRERTVTHILTNFDVRLSTQKMLRIQCENMRKWLGNKPFPL